MKLLNGDGIDFLLFKSIERAMCNHISREEGGYYVSVTQLLKDPQQVILEWRHGDKVERDAMDCIDLFMGTAIHEYISETAEKTGYKGLSEKRWKTTVAGKVVSGGMDHGIIGKDGEKLWICDYKVVKSYAAAMTSKHDDWEAQLNMYAYMSRENGYDPTRLSIIPLIKDFAQGTRGKAIKDYKTGEEIGRHPSTQVSRIDFDVWPQEKTLKFMEERVERLVEADKCSDSKLAVSFKCVDLWRNNMKCNKYCNVRPFCKQASKLK